jgi:outer membrane protein assembly factor BamB
MKRKFSIVCGSFALLVLAAGQHQLCAEARWPQFRGPNSSGVADNQKPPIQIGPGTNQLWKVEVPSGLSSPCVWGDRIFLTAFEDGKLQTRCYSRRDGKLLWNRVTPADQLEEFHSTEGSPAASTPATDGKRVVSYFGSCGLVCYDLDGKEHWRHTLPVAQTAGAFGSGGSPAIVNGLVLVNRDQLKDCSLLAVDLRTGKKAWETARPDVSQSYGTPIHWKHGGAVEVVMSGSLRLKGYDVKTGKERWSLSGMPSFTCTTPVVGDDLLFFAGWSPGKEAGSMPTFDYLAGQFDKDKNGAITREEVAGTDFASFFRSMDVNGDGKITAEDLDTMKAMMAKGENVLVAVKPGGKGQLAASHVAWKATRGLPYVPSPLYYRGRVYLVKDGGMASCFDAATGREIYLQERVGAIGSYYASPIAADGRIYLASLNGAITVYAAGDKPEVLGRADLGERMSATPAIADNKLYIRTANHLWAFGK